MSNPEVFEGRRTNRGRSARLRVVVVMAWAFTYVVSTGLAADLDEYLPVLDAARTKRGLVVHLPCRGGALVAAMAELDGVVVQGLDTDIEQVAQTRARVASAHAGRTAGAERLIDDQLPYIDNLVNLIVLDDPTMVSREELIRALAPGGQLWIRQTTAPSGKRLESKTNERATWTTVTKDRPEDIDEWTHYRHDASGNAVGHDERVGPPAHMQWIGTPEYLRHHDFLSGLSAMVTAGGRLFYIIDLGPRWAVEMPSRWTLVARDAFSGVLLWQKPMGKWHPHFWPLKKGPATLMRRMVADSDTVLVTMESAGPVVALDAATGRVKTVYERTRGTEELIVADGTLFALVNPRGDVYATVPSESVEAARAAGRNWNWDERPREIVAIELASGRLLWTLKTPVAPTTLAAADGSLVFHDGTNVRCVEARHGKPLWTSPPVARWKPMHVLFGPSLLIYEDVVLCAGGEKMDPLRGGRDTMTALSARTGRHLWSAPHPSSGYASAEDLLVVDGLVWCGSTTNRRDTGVMTGRDVHTGAVVREFAPDDWQPHMPHHRCYQAKATGHFILTSRTGIELVDVRAKHWDANHWVRGSCNFGIMPANGLIYAPPHSCACYLLAKLSGLNALASTQSTTYGRRIERAPERLQRGTEARTSTVSEPADIEKHEWPSYRGGPSRSAASNALVPVDLRRAWTIDLKSTGKLTPPVVAGGKLLVSSIEDRQVHAVDAASGSLLWSFDVGGSVDSPPTLWRDRVIFGSRDGYVYCLLAADGRLVWKLRAAPADLRLFARGQVESVWPVPGSVLIVDDVVFCVAGRSAWLDGGMRLLRIDAESGSLLSETVLNHLDPDTKENLQEGIQWPNLPVALPDVLSYDGYYVYMRAQPFNLKGLRPEIFTPVNHELQEGSTAHLFSPTGFLDDSWWHRTYWMFGRTFISGAGGWDLATYRAPTGRILVVDGPKVFGFGRIYQGYRQAANQYQLYGCDRSPELIGNRVAAKRSGGYSKGSVQRKQLRYDWNQGFPVYVRAMCAGRNTLFVAGPHQEVDEGLVYRQYSTPEVQEKMKNQMAAFAGQQGGVLTAVDKKNGKILAAYQLDAPPVFDGLAVTDQTLFASLMNGSVVCLRPDGRHRLAPAEGVDAQPLPTTASSFQETHRHPDFQVLQQIKVDSSKLGYRLESKSRDGGLALMPLATPVKSGQSTFVLKIRPRPGASPPTPGNGFFALGPKPDAKQLVKCGFRISGQRLYIVTGPFSAGVSKSVPVRVQANELVTLKVTVDLEQRMITVAMKDSQVSGPLPEAWKEISWIGYCIASVEAEFSPIETTRSDDRP